MGLVVELETAAPVPGPQDTGSGGNRVLYESSGASRLTIKAEQKPGHFMTEEQQNALPSIFPITLIRLGPGGVLGSVT